jgi:hypothetical protein
VDGRVDHRSRPPYHCPVLRKLSGSPMTTKDQKTLSTSRKHSQLPKPKPYLHHHRLYLITIKASASRGAFSLWLVSLVFPSLHYVPLVWHVFLQGCWSSACSRSHCTSPYISTISTREAIPTCLLLSSRYLLVWSTIYEHLCVNPHTQPFSIDQRSSSALSRRYIRSLRNAPETLISISSKPRFWLC